MRFPGIAMKTRCAWAGNDPLYVSYHDEEWGVPLHDDRKLFEFLILEGAQAGLSWRTILGKRPHYRRAFARFDARKVARFGKAELTAMLADPGLVRNRMKLEAAIGNARAFLAVQKEAGSFDRFVWSFVDHRPIENRWTRGGQVPAESDESRALSKELRRRDFRFVGPTICYAFMQAVGMVNDHLVECFRYRELAGGRR